MILEWDEATKGDVDQYFIDFKEEKDTKFVPAGRIDGKKSKFICSFLEKDKSYYFSVRPKNAAGFSNQDSFLEKPVKLQPVKGSSNKNKPL